MAFIGDLARQVIDAATETEKSAGIEAVRDTLRERAERTLLGKIQHGEIPNDVRIFLEFRDKMMKGVSIKTLMGEVDTLGDIADAPAENMKKANGSGSYDELLKSIVHNIANKKSIGYF